MTTQTAFTPQEWNLLRTVPALVASGVAAADPGGIFASMKEAFAGMKGCATRCSRARGSNCYRQSWVTRAGRRCRTSNP